MSHPKQDHHDLYEHIRPLISSLVLDRQSLDTFEHYSSQLKYGNGSECVFKVRQAYAHLKDYQVKNRALIGKLNTGTEEQPVEPPSVGYVPDFAQEAKLFEKFGIGFGEQEAYRIFKSLCKLALKKNAKQLRLWGKILCSEKDYYIAEGISDSTEQAGQLSADTEPKGVGVNKNQYWATTELTSEWTELPIITPTQIKVSRVTKHILTGDLNRNILTNPLFPGKEAHLLKCQIVRINSTCSIIPKGMMIVNAQSGEVQAPQEFAMPDVSVLAEKESWVYQNGTILKNGRTTLLKPEGMEPEDEEKWVKAMNLKDPSEPKLKNIVLDSQNWSVRSVNLDDTYRSLGKIPKVINKGVVGIKNLLWPGWLTTYSLGKFTSVYVGYAHKFKQNYYPFDPERVLTESQDRAQFVVNQ